MRDLINKVIEGDCLSLLPLIPDGAIDMILCDLPYGTTQNPWDKRIDLERLWQEYKRITKKDGVIVLTAQGKFTGELIMSNKEDFKYKIVWLKTKATNFLNANKQPLRRHEDICVFYSQQGIYNPQKLKGLPYFRGFRKDNNSGNYGHFGTFAIANADGKRFPSDVFFSEEEIPDWISCKAPADTDGIYHPVQKPVTLGRWLIRTYSRQGDIILDNACGSGSFLVAAIKENRKFIGMEENISTYHFGNKVDLIAVCRKRIQEALSEVEIPFLDRNQRNG